MSDKIIKQALYKRMKSQFLMWALIGAISAILIGGTIYYAEYHTFQQVNDHSQHPSNVPQISRSKILASEVLDNVPEIVHLQVLGNATGNIYPNLLDAEFDRIGNSTNYSWNVSSEILTQDLQVQKASFLLSQSEVDTIGQAFYDSISSTEAVGKYGQGTNDLELGNLQWGMVMFLENHTLIGIYVYEDIVLFATGDWNSDYTGSPNLIGADILVPPSSFDTLLSVLSDLFHNHLGS